MIFLKLKYEIQSYMKLLKGHKNNTQIIQVPLKKIKLQKKICLGNHKLEKKAAKQVYKESLILKLCLWNK